jgi:hypothetical protein
MGSVGVSSCMQMCVLDICENEVGSVGVSSCMHVHICLSIQNHMCMCLIPYVVRVKGPNHFKWWTRRIPGTCMHTVMHKHTLLCMHTHIHQKYPYHHMCVYLLSICEHLVTLLYTHTYIYIHTHTYIHARMMYCVIAYNEKTYINLNVLSV